MNKILIILGLCSSVAVYAAPTSASQPVSQSSICQQYHKQMRDSRQALDAAYHSNDACTMGKLMIQNRQMYESHPECFPRMSKIQQLSQQQGQAK